MKNLIVIIGTILLGVFITTTLILGDDGSLKSAATGILSDGISEIESITEK